MNVVAFSGGKDSTSMALRLHELGEKFVLLFTATEDELPDVPAHIAEVVRRTGAELVTPPGPRLLPLIEQFNSLPNFRQRWCTRMIKIAPCVAWLKQHPGSTLCVGLRADEQEREGLYGDYATYRYPLREWGWGVQDVLAYCAQQGIKVPQRTDCALCYHQRLGEWFRLWRDYPDRYAQGVELERRTGHTFRSPGRDTWPAGLAELAVEFAKGRKIRERRPRQNVDQCRVCRF